MATTNPLLNFTGLPAFDRIMPEHVAPALDCILSENRNRRESLLAHGRVTWDDFAQPLEDMQERLARMWSPVSHLNGVMNNDALRAAYNDGVPRLTDYASEVAQDPRLYAGYKRLAASVEFATLAPAQRKIIEYKLRDFRLNGAELAPEAQARFRQIQTELALLGSRFSENVLDATQAWELVLTDPADLAGLPETVQQLARQTAEHDGKPGFKFTLDGPSYIAFMSYADRRELRRQMYDAMVTRASELGPHAGRWDNGSVIEQIIRLRREAARLVGFTNYAEYALQTRMAKQVTDVLAFLYDLAARARPVAQRDLDELRAYAREQHGIADIEPWDIAYYAEKLRAHRFAFTEEDLRPYFPAARVIAGMFEVVRRLYGLDIRAVEGAPTWHPDVRFYEIRDADGRVRGRFYTDLYARPHKRGGAWMDDCIGRKRIGGEVQIPVAYLTCNFAPPVGDGAALLTHNEVITLFHEFGHGLHHMLTQVDYVGVSGINGVAWDAVELPSQLMENWCWEREALAFLSGHYQTGAHLPSELYQKMHAAKNFQAGLQFVRQLEFALFDMRLHSDHDPDGDQTVQELLDEVRAEVAVLRPPPYNRFQTSFSHVFAGGYAAGYYSYKWAEVLSADVYSKFEERGVFDPAVGREFLREVLEQGGVRDALDAFVAFRGRKPSIEALLRHSGIAA